MHQSPKSKRTHGSAEKPSDDGLPTRDQGGIIPRQTGTSPLVPQVPNLDFSDGKYQGGNTPSESVPGSGAAANNSGGGPGAAKSEDAQRTGGTPARFSGDRGRNG